MEAFAAVSLAGNILQFLQFVISVISSTADFKRSVDGNIKSLKEIQTVIKNLDSHMENITADTEKDYELKSLAKQCQMVGNELQQALGNVLGDTKHKILGSSLAKAIRKVWSEKKVQKIEDRLRIFQSQIILHLQQHSRTQLAELVAATASFESQLEQGRSEITSARNEQQKDLATLRFETDQRLNSILQKIEETRHTPEEVLRSVQELKKLLNEILRMQIDLSTQNMPLTNKPTKQDFLDTLYFRGLDEREEEIATAHARTFQWLLMNPKLRGPGAKSDFQAERRRLYDNIKKQLSVIGLEETDCAKILRSRGSEQDASCRLQEWFEEETGIFWITGKPGSGKSTFMKAIYQNKDMYKDLHSKLKIWSKGYRLLEARFFLFRTGLDLQKSHLGLLQSLLYQLLSQGPELIDEVFSSRSQREAIARAAKIRGSDESPWSILELEKAMRGLAAVPGNRIYIHIDGIDEMERESEDIAQILSSIAGDSTIKILVAGRYTPEFQEAFGTMRTLKLDEVTTLDIASYTIGKLNPQVWADQDATPTQRSEIIEELIKAAKGVFLWVKIVVDSLLGGLRHFENFQQITQRLKQFPKELEKLYQFLLDDLNPSYRAKAAFWLLTTYYSQDYYNKMRFISKHRKKLTFHGLLCAEKMNLTDVSCLSDLNDQNTVNDPECRKRQNKEANLLQERIKRQCKHFFEFQSKGIATADKKVDFAHRTVFDFLSKDGVFRELHALLEPEVDPITALVASDIHQNRALNHGVQSYAPLQGLAKLRDTVRNEHILKFSKQVVHSMQNSWRGPTKEEQAIPCHVGWRYCDSGTFLPELADTSKALPIMMAACGASPDVSDPSFRLPDFETVGEKDDFVFFTALIPTLSKNVGGIPREVFTMTEEAHRIMSIIFPKPNGIDGDSRVFTRHLESTRLAILETIYSLSDYEFECNLKDQISFTGMENFLKCGADPDTLCGPVKKEGDRSTISALSLFLAIKDKVKKYIEQPRFSSSSTAGIRRVIPEIDRCVALLRQEGAKEIKITATDGVPGKPEQETLPFRTTQEGTHMFDGDQKESFISCIAQEDTFYTAQDATQRSDRSEEDTQLLDCAEETSQSLDLGPGETQWPSRSHGQVIEPANAQDLNARTTFSTELSSR